MPPHRNRLDPATLVLLLLPPLFWAGNAIVGRMAVGTVAPVALNLLRWLLAGMLLLPFAWRGVVLHRATIAREWGVIAWLAVFGVAAYNALQYLALTTSTPINVTLIAASTPVFVLAVGSLFFGERVSLRGAMGALVSIAGVLIVMLRGDVGRFAALAFVPGDLFMLAAAAAWSIYTWLLQKKRPDLPLVVLLFVQIMFGVLFIAPFAFVEATVFHVPTTLDTPRAWAVLAYVAVLPSLVGYFCWDHGVARAGAALPVFFANLTPVFAALLSALLFGEWPQWYHGLGLVLILAGIRLAGR